MSLTDSIFDDAYYDQKTDRWIVTNNSTDIAEQLKRIYPNAPVFLYNKETGDYTRYTISYVHQKPHMKNGVLLYEKQIIEI